MWNPMTKAKEGILVATLFIPTDQCNVLSIQQFVHPDAVEFFCHNVIGMSEVGECCEAWIVHVHNHRIFMTDINEIIIHSVRYDK